jgi:hypothetical protein
MSGIGGSREHSGQAENRRVSRSEHAGVISAPSPPGSWTGFSSAGNLWWWLFIARCLWPISGPVIA